MPEGRGKCRRVALAVPMPMVRLLLALLVMSLVQSVANAQDSSVRAQLSASSITRDESVVLTITAIGIDAELDASSLDKDFDVVGRSSSRQISTVIDSSNKAVKTSVVTWALELLPNGQGVFTVPAVKVGDLETQLMTLTVAEVPQGAKRDIFLEASVDDTTPWVQSQVVMSLRVFQAIDIVDGGLDTPFADNLQVERIGEDTRAREVRDGRQYSVTERRFALFPQKSGTLTVDPVTLSVTVPAEPDRVRGFFSPTRKLTRRSDPITLHVKARPTSGVAWWLPARQLTLDSQWQGDPDSAQVDQPLTRTLVMRAKGVLESQLPQISIPAIDGLSLYAEDPKLAMDADASGLVAEQRINWALIPQRSGTLTLPAISVEWFNTLTGQTEITELPPETITVAPSSAASSSGGSNDGSAATTFDSDGATGSAALAGLSNSGANSGTQPELQEHNETQALNSADSTMDESLVSTAVEANIVQMSQRMSALELSAQGWRLAAIGILAIWLLTMVIWLMQRNRTSGGGEHPARGGDGLIGHGEGRRPGYKQRMSTQIDALYQQLAPLNQVEKACKAGDLPQVKRALLEWSARQWSVDAPTTLDALQARLPAGVAKDKIAQLQSALYSKTGQAEGMPPLAESLATLPDELMSTLQQSSAERSALEAANDGQVTTKKNSRLPQL